MNQNKKSSASFTDIATVAVFLIIIFGFAVLFFALPDKKTSDEENRSLQQFPEFTADNLVSGKFTGDIAKYCADQFPFRNVFVGVKAAMSYALLINENKGAVIAKDSYIIQRHDIYDEYDMDFDLDFSFNEIMKYIKTNCEHINIFKTNLAELGEIGLKVAIVPRKIDIMTNKLPNFFPTERNQAHYDMLEQNLNGDIFIDLRDALLPRNNEYIYYRTDHHWTTLGAFYAYSMIGEAMGYEPYAQNRFSIEKAADDFYGTSWSKSGAKWIPPDDIYYYTLGDESGMITNINQNKQIQGFYDMDYLETKDKYSSFIGGINAHTSIYPSERVSFAEPREKLLLITDSFGQSIAPFLARHYDIEVIDMRFFNEKAQSIYDFIRDNNITHTLILVGIESISNQNNLIKLRSK